MEVLKRIINSKKVITTTLSQGVVLFSASQGVNNLVLVGMEVVFAILLLAQAALDYKYGSKSDGTAP